MPEGFLNCRRTGKHSVANWVEGRLGDFQLQALRRKPRLGKCTRQGVDEIVLQELNRRERLTETLMSFGQCAASLHAVCSSHSPSWVIIPVSSASGMN